jgi:hypothetical protein
MTVQEFIFVGLIGMSRSLSHRIAMVSVLLTSGAVWAADREEMAE